MYSISWRPCLQLIKSSPKKGYRLSMIPDILSPEEVKDVGLGAVKSIVSTRKEGNFTSLFDFLPAGGYGTD
jgi:hypothetical protein